MDTVFVSSFELIEASRRVHIPPRRSTAMPLLNGMAVNQLSDSRNLTNFAGDIRYFVRG